MLAAAWVHLTIRYKILQHYKVFDMGPLCGPHVSLFQLRELGPGLYNCKNCKYKSIINPTLMSMLCSNNNDVAASIYCRVHLLNTKMLILEVDLISSRQDLNRPPAHGSKAT